MEDNLGYMRTEAPLLAPIFRSDGQARLLAALLLGNDELSVTDLASRAGLAYPTAHREVARLLEAGILVERSVGRTRLIRDNPDSPLVSPLREILVVSAGPAALLTEELGHIAGVESAFLYGSFAARLLGVEGAAPNDIDVMVIGTPDAGEVYDICTRVEAAVHRPVNPTILTPAELADQSGFLESVRSGPIVPLIGELPWP
jgi:DNA-binding transcriptional ArsR family regulator